MSKTSTDLDLNDNCKETKQMALRTRVIRFLSALALGLAVTIGVGVVIQPSASASHNRLGIDGNSSGTQFTYTFQKGVVGNGGLPGSPQTLKWCNNLGGYSSQVSTAFSDWDNTLSGWTQFSSNCSGSDIQVQWGTCATGAWACAPGNWSYDSVRRAYYLTGGQITLVSAATTWNNTKVLEVVRHELGHHMGLWEWYLHTSPLSCNPNAPSTVMDLAPNISFGCGDGSTVTSADSTDVNALYRFGTVSSVVPWDCTAYYPGRTLCVNWYDDEPANAHTYIDIWKCTTSACTSRTYVGAQWSYGGAGLYNANNSTSYGYSLSSGYHQVTTYYSNAMNGLGPGVNSSSVYLQ